MRLQWQCPPDAWQRLVDQCPTATFFHSPVWAATAETSGLASVKTLWGAWPDGRQALMILEARRIWAGLRPAAHVGIQAGYGGIITNGPFSDAELQPLYAELKRRYPDCTATTNPFAAAAPPAGFTVSAAAPTRVMNLAPLEAMRQHYNRERQKAVRRYQKDNVTVQMVSHPGEAELRQFTRLYAQEVAAWKAGGRSVHRVPPALWFESLFRMARDRLQLAFASIDGEVVGVNSFAAQGAIASELYLAWDRRFQSSQVSTALKEACFAAAWAQGLTHLDFMASGDLDGVERFKVSFGAGALPVWHYQHQSRLSRLLLSLKSGHSQPATAG